MKTHLILALAVCMSGAALADWTHLGVASHRTTDYYVDLSTAQTAVDGKVTIAYLYDMKQPAECAATAKPYLSSAGETEFDCTGKLYRVVSCTRYAGPHAGGEVVSADSGPGEWSKIPPRSRVANMYKTVCGRSLK
jgi:hypothetical protein